MKFSNITGLPRAFVKVLEDMERKNLKPVSQSISTTMLIDSPKAVQLKLRHADEIEEDVTDRVWAFLGTAFHKIMEGANKSLGNDAEKLLSIPHRFGGVITGTMDVYDDTDKAIYDYKTTSVWTAAVYRSRNAEWETQLNIYAYLYMHYGFEVKHIAVIAVMRDWMKSKAGINNYPEEGIITIPLRLWSKEEIEKYINDRLSLHLLVEGKEDDEIPECTPEERWKTETQYKIYKDSNKTATKVCDTITEAEKEKTELELKYPKSGFRIVPVPGEDRRCTGYCPMNKFCHYWKNTYGKTADVSGGFYE